MSGFLAVIFLIIGGILLYFLFDVIVGITIAFLVIAGLTSIFSGSFNDCSSSNTKKRRRSYDYESDYENFYDYQDVDYREIDDDNSDLY